MDNSVHDNNNPNVPAHGLSAEGPVGTGMSVSGGRNDTIIHNTFAHNGAWGVIFVPFLDNGPPCTGGTQEALGCLFDEWGDALKNNVFVGNGFFGHPTNGDFGWFNLQAGNPTNCWSGNLDQGSSAATPASAQALQTQHPSCDGTTTGVGSSDPNFFNEVLCNAQISITGGPVSCPSGQYPRYTRAVLHALPTRKLKSMPNPCANVPNNAWCKAGKPV
jgi:hypothetical protein